MDTEEGVLISEAKIEPNTLLEESAQSSCISRLESLLKCGICYEYFDTCVMTDCSHNFCSLCIRRYIQFKTECPVCFKELYDSSLRANRVVDEFREIFPDLKDRFLQYLRVIKSRKPGSIYSSPSKTAIEAITTPTKAASSRSCDVPDPTPLPPKSSPNVSSVAKPSGIQTPTVQDRVLIPRMFLSPMKKGTSNADKNASMHECPVCNVFIPERNMNRHLDDCLLRNEKATKAKNSPVVTKRSPLPKLIFRLLTTNNLRNKAKEYGLNPHGDNETLKNRIQKYTALYNAECDKPNPRPPSELIRQLEREEKTLASQKAPKILSLPPLADVSDKSRLNALYLKENKKSFAELIEKMKSNQAKKSEKKAVVSDDYCQPSTSKTNFDYAMENDDMLEIDEMKVEKMDNDSQNQERPLSEKQSSEDDDVFNPIRRRNFRGKLLDFEGGSKESDQFDVSLVKFEPEVEIFEALTDDENEKAFGEDVDDMPGSPIISKPIRRKRRAIDEPVRKTLRKKRR